MGRQHRTELLNLLGLSGQLALVLQRLLQGQDRQRYQLEILLASKRYLNLGFALSVLFLQHMKRHCIQQGRLLNRRCQRTTFPDNGNRQHRI